jgi:hypothetical protein
VPVGAACHAGIMSAAALVQRRSLFNNGVPGCAVRLATVLLVMLCASSMQLVACSASRPCQTRSLRLTAASLLLTAAAAACAL